MKSLDDVLPPAPAPKREFPDSFYDDDDPTSSKPPTGGGVSKEMREKLLNESIGLGGVPGKAMPSNLFLNIILLVLALADFELSCFASASASASIAGEVSAPRLRPRPALCGARFRESSTTRNS